ncbi:MAG TPA: M36 family metallopeptidase [Pyrinomonadaceae bacterium]|nr:M36 family metallopeptidase [Pyrinomonadaceae bacterium]
MSNIAAANAFSINRQLQTRKAAIEKALARLKTFSRGAEVKSSPLTGGVEVLRSTTGALSAQAAGRNGEDIVRGFINANRDLYGLSPNDIASLKFSGESVSAGNGMRMVRVEQTVNRLPVFQSDTRFILDAQGRVMRSTGLIIPGVQTLALTFDELISAQAALSVAMNSVEIQIDPSQATLTNANADGTEVEIVANNPNISGIVTSKLVYFPLAPGILVPAWSQVTFTNGSSGDWYTLVDATSGKLLWRKNIRDNVSNHNARFRVYVQADGTTPADSPAPLSPTNATVGSNTQPPGISPQVVSMFTAMSSTASPNGWINDCPGSCTDAERQTIGNNVHAYMDREGGENDNEPDTVSTSRLDGAGKPRGNPDSSGRTRDFLGIFPRNFETSYLPPPRGGDPEKGQTASGNGNNGTQAVDQFRRGMLTQLFYVTNWYHDKLFLLGFDEAAGNFQKTNFSGNGLDDDHVLAEGQDNLCANNAFFSTPEDGQSGRAEMCVFDGPAVHRDGALDSEILIHELTHGLTNRLIGNAAGLIWTPSLGLGEGWSDFYALSLLNNTNDDDPNGMYAMGAYATYKLGGSSYTDNYLYGIRRFPYSTNNSINPLTWADADDYTNNLSGGLPSDPLGNNLNGAGQPHNVGEIWALTLWEVRSRIIAANGGNVPIGNQIMLQLVTDALKMTPISPSYIDARDALIDADCATNGCANEQSIWDGFADRGLGYGARVSSVQGFVPVSPLTPFAPRQGILESSTVPGLDVQNVAVNDTLGNNNGTIDGGESIKITVTLTNPWRHASKNVASASANLTTATPNITITDGSSSYGAIPAQGSAGGDEFQFSVPLSATCGQSIKFTITSTSSLGVKAVNFQLRVGAPNGVAAPVTYTRTLGVPLTIPDASFSGVIDSLTITDDFEIADLNFRVDSIQHIFPINVTVGFKAPNGYGVDLIAAIGLFGGADGPDISNMVIDNQATADMQLATDAPYTGSWSPIWDGPPDPVGVLNRMNGASTQGIWQVLVSDQISDFTGTLNGWSLIVTPRAFSCTPRLIISEFRLRGPGGANDEFIEIYNHTGAPHTVAASGGGTGYAIAASDGVVRCVIPNGTVIPQRGHFLCTNSAAYSLSGYASGDATYATDIPDNAGIALFNTSVPANFTSSNRMDAVGSASESNTLYKEGTGYPPLTPLSIDYAFVRDECNEGGPSPNLGPCKLTVAYVDTHNNAADFLFVATDGSNAGAGQRLGAPGPQNLASPVRRHNQFVIVPLDTTVSPLSAPNRVVDPTPDPANNSTFGTFEARIRVFNFGPPVTRLRIRITDLGTLPAPPGIADLRVRTSSSVMVSGVNDSGTCMASNGVATTPCTVNVQGITLEQPPSQLLGGGFNCTLSAPLPSGTSFNLRLLFGIQQSGTFNYGITLERLPG